MINLLAVAIGGAVGSMGRYGLAVVMARMTGGAFPWGTLMVNISGSFLIGLFWALLEQKSMLDTPWRALLIIGLLGGFTTFSSFSLETLALMQEMRWLAALLNMAASVVGCLLAVGAGVAMARNFAG